MTKKYENYPRTKKPAILRFLEKLRASKTVYIFHDLREIEEFLNALGK